MTSDGGAAGPRCLQHQGPTDCVLCGVPHVSVDEADSRVYTNFRKYMCADRGLAPALSPSIRRIAKSGCPITPSRLFALQTEAEVVGWLMATAALEGSDAVTFYRTGMKQYTPPEERKRRRANDQPPPAMAHQQPVPDVPCSGIPQAPPPATAAVQPARFRPVPPVPASVWIALPPGILPDRGVRLAHCRQGRAPPRVEFVGAGAGGKLSPTQLAAGWSPCDLRTDGDLADILNPARLLILLGLLRGLDDEATWCLQMLQAWAAGDGEPLFPHVLLQSLALIVELLREQLNGAGVSYAAQWAPHLTAVQLDDEVAATLHAHLPEGTRWCLLVENKTTPVLHLGPTEWRTRFPGEEPPEAVVSWVCRAEGHGVRAYAEKLRAACNPRLLLPKRQLEVSKHRYMDLLSAFTDLFSVLPSLRIHLVGFPGNPAPAHVLEFRLALSGGGGRLLDRSGKEVPFDEALKRLVGLQTRLGPPVENRTAVVKGDTGSCAQFVEFCETPSEFCSLVERWGGDSDTAEALFPVTVQLKHPGFRHELCCGFVQQRDGRYGRIPPVVKASDPGADPGTSTMQLVSISVERDLCRLVDRHIRPDAGWPAPCGESTQGKPPLAGLTEVANALPALFRAEADSMPLVRFDFLVVPDAGGSGGLRYYLNEMQTGLAARLLCDQLANPIVIAQSWAEGAVGCLQRQRQAAQPEASGPR